MLVLLANVAFDLVRKSYVCQTVRQIRALNNLEIGFQGSHFVELNCLRA